MSKIGWEGGGAPRPPPLVYNTFSDRGAGISKVLVGIGHNLPPSDRIGFI